MDADEFDSTGTVTATDELPTTTSREKLKMEVAALIRRYDECDLKPPFSAEELIVITLLLSHKPLVDQAILMGILLRFRYYSLLVLEDYTTNVLPQHRLINVSCVVQGFEEAFKSYDLPVYESRNEIGRKMYRVDADEARIFLRHHLEPARIGTFPLLDLSAELRNIVYELMLSFKHDDGFFFNDDPISLLLLQRSNGAPRGNVRTKWQINDRDHPVIYVKPRISQALAITTTCKQVYSEALSCFYAINSFRFGGFTAIQLWSSRVPDIAFTHLTSIVIQSGHVEGLNQFLSSTLKRFDSIKSLRHFCLGFPDCDDDCWLKLKEWERRYLHVETDFVSMKQVPGIYDLAALAAKAETYKIIGDLPQFKAFIRAIIQRIKAGSTLIEIIKADNEPGIKTRSSTPDEAHLLPRRSARIAAQKPT